MEISQYVYLYGLDNSKDNLEKTNLVIYTSCKEREETLDSLRGFFVSPENLESTLLCGGSRLEFPKDQMSEIAKEYKGEFLAFK